MDVWSQYKARKEANERRAAERKPTPLWWLGQHDPIARFTKWLVIWTALLFVGTVASTGVLWKTDDTLQKTLIDSNRAWIAPKEGDISNLEKGKALTITIHYVNTGRSPAFSVLGYHTQAIFSLSDWSSGKIGKTIDDEVTTCFNVKTLPPESQVVYPTVGSVSYNSSYDSDDPLTIKKYVTTDDLISGSEIYVSQGCFSYRTIDAIVHHSAYCYFYRAKITHPPSMSICNIGNNAN